MNLPPFWARLSGTLCPRYEYLHFHHADCLLTVLVRASTKITIHFSPSDYIRSSMDHPCQFTIQFIIPHNILTPDSVACTLHHRDNLGLLTLSYLDERRSGQRS